jgi:uncharacterized protein YkwD
MSQARSPWILTLLLSAVASTAAAQEAPSGPISRFFRRDQRPAAHQHHHQHHHHVHAQPATVAVATEAAPAYEYTYAQVQWAEVEAEPVAQAAEAVGQPAEVHAQPLVYQPAAAPAYEYQTGGDPYGFTNVLNRIRAAAGLHPLSYDPSLSSWAHQNNAEQCRRGLGHHVNPTGTQNCAYNYSDANSAAAGWMNSPGHRENMLSPTATSFGIAFGPGPYWTMNAR